MKQPENFFRLENAHKSSCGKLVILAGSKGYAGAGILCSHAAVVGGCGYVRWCVPESLYEAVAASFIDGIVTPLWDGGTGVFQRDNWQVIKEFQPTALVVGPGWGQGAGQKGLLDQIINDYQGPLLIDADALNLLADNINDLAQRKPVTVITPHPGEAARLLNQTVGDIEKDREGSIKKLQHMSLCIVVLKGAHTLVAFDEKLWKNESASSILATAGSGDVLSGLIGSLLARHIDPFEAACFSVHWHHRAGKLLEDSYGPQGVGASALIDALREIQGDGIEC